MTALRLSAILSILVAAIYVQGGIAAIGHSAPIDVVCLLMVGIAAPLVPGVLAFWGRATFLLPAAWGWTLGVHLPKLLIPAPALPTELVRSLTKSHGRVFITGPDYFGMALVTTAVIGLALCGYSYYREQHLPAT
jgi:hypothetical protein